MAESVRGIFTSRAPKHGGHYSQAIAYRDLLFVSGQLPVSPDGTHRREANFETQCRQCIANLFGILTEAGTSPERVLRVSAYIVSSAQWREFDVVFGEAFGPHRPARTVIPVPELHFGYLVEIDAVAALESP